MQWLSRSTGQPYRLPSEAEWEYAARAGSTAAHSWPDDGESSCRAENLADRSCKSCHPKLDRKTSACSDGQPFAAPVARFQANAFGLYDMSGNVMQWVQDCWHHDYVGAPVDAPDISLSREGQCGMRVIRGGAYDSPEEWAGALRR